jgi:hypothetical protein
MPRMASTALIPFLLALSTGVVPPQDPERATALVEQAKQKLAAIGLEVPAAVTVAERDAKHAIADLDAQQDVLFPAGGFAVQRELRRAVGLPGARDAAALRAQAVASMARGLSAYYDPLQKTFVLLPTATRDTAELIGGSLLPLVVHELTHACQDARDGGLAKFFDAANATLDATLVRRCVLEGEAELASVVALHGEGTVEQALLRGGVEDIEKLLAGELTGLYYQYGRRLVGASFRARGWPAVRALWSTPPPSCEQVMHPEKLGNDVPQVVAAPTIDGTEVVHRTTIGELMLYSLLRDCRVGSRDAALAAAGWDGDELVLLRAQPGDSVCFVWRSVWDRDEDAAQFAAALPKNVRTAVAVAGRVVDVVSAAENDLRKRLASACAAAEATPVANEADAASTVAVEARLRARDEASAVRGDTWELPELGASIPVPKGWELREVQGTKLLLDPATAPSGFAVNVNVQALPLGPGVDLEAMLAANRAQLEQLKLTVVSLEIAKCGDVDVLRGEFHGRFGKQPAVHCLQLIQPRGDRQVVITATARPKQMATHEATLRELMAGIVVRPAPK